MSRGTDTLLAIAEFGSKDYGESPCCHFVADVVYRVTGLSIQLRPYSADEVAQYTSDGLLEIVTTVLAAHDVVPCDVSDTEDGDPVLLRNSVGAGMMGVRVQSKVAVRSLRGVSSLPMSHSLFAAVCGWRIPCRQ